jgi:hypothetical protein
MRPMEELKFTEEKFVQRHSTHSESAKTNSRMVRYLIGSGLAKNSKQGTIILIVCILTLLTVSAFIFARQRTSRVDSKPYSDMSPAEKQSLPATERLFLENLNN